MYVDRYGRLCGWESVLPADSGSQADILSETGGTCVCDKPLTLAGYCQNESQWQSCSSGKKTTLFVRCARESMILINGSVEVKQDLITATAALAGLASVLFGFFTNLPVALA